MSLVDPEGKNAVIPAIVVLSIPVFIFRNEIIDLIPCKDPQQCANEKTIKELMEKVKKESIPKPGQCEPPKSPRPAAPREKRLRRV